MPEIGSQWFNPFDPQDPDALASAALGTNPQEYATQVAEAPQKRLAIYRKPVQVQDPQQRISGGFGAMDVEDRTAPGYPGAFLYSGSAFDPREADVLGVPKDEGGYWLNQNRAPQRADYDNPLSRDAGLLYLHHAALVEREKAERAEANRRAMLGEKRKETEVK